MTVKELKKQLENLDDNLEIIMPASDGEKFFKFHYPVSKLAKTKMKVMRADTPQGYDCYYCISEDLKFPIVSVLKFQ